jgi:hypothetical protein
MGEMRPPMNVAHTLYKDVGNWVRRLVVAILAIRLVVVLARGFSQPAAQSMSHGFSTFTPNRRKRLVKKSEKTKEE